MLILHDLWTGNIDTGKIETQKYEHEKANKQYATTKEEFYKILPPEILEKYEALESENSELRIMEEYDAFVKGFRLGVKMMLDVFGDYSCREN